MSGAMNAMNDEGEVSLEEETFYHDVSRLVDKLLGVITREHGDDAYDFAVAEAAISELQEMMMLVPRAKQALDEGAVEHFHYMMED